MSKLIFKTLYIFSSVEKKAKVVNFLEGTNIITSSAVDGTKRGKSLIAKCLYHTMGADCFFEPIWDNKDKTYILFFDIDGIEYYMYRSGSLFKLFDANKNVIFKTINRNELGEKLKNIFNFAVQLPKREEEKLEITPPVYNYLLYYLDQDRILGTQFASFDGLGQYPDFKENVLYYHFGAFDERYYEIERQLEKIHEEIKVVEKKRVISEGIYEKINSNIRDVSYTKNFELLKRDVERTKEKYISISNALSEIRTNLIKLRNEKAEIMASINSLKIFERDNEKQIKTLNKHVCPFCNSTIEDALSLRISKYSISEDIILLSNNMQITISELERKIEKQENEYKKWLAELKRYEDALVKKHGEIDDVLAHRGYIEIKDEIIQELYTLREKIDQLSKQERELKKEERGYIEAKRKINTRYYELMKMAKNQFNLEEIKDKSFEKITGTFKGGGSNKPIATIIWYLTLLKLRKEFNPSAINFPVVFDSPNNAETDQEKKGLLYKYIVENTPKDNQVIISGIGYENEQTFGVAFNHVINLSNDKYHLLCVEDYDDYSSILIELCSK
ncbi:MAG: hypothetical protein IJN77_08985 [Oscillospiraceae bacterium]|nr:hypothetical protein [Oscillospiraceae bacterium]